ncbi:MAG: LytTR family DNA-binding domain-containing protein [Maribacter sp.]|uniref:LytR/AlgR family response regulator transcription factor n=1 Tax=Maribacter sp. TaxID=1897614 RepID=UPI00329A5559
MINCIVIDDEPLAREGIIDYIEKTDFLKLIGEGANPTQIHKLSGVNTIDLLFLDIQMPIMTGLEYLKNTSQRPIVVLTTAYPSYALESFELDVLDYLVKPITFSRFYKSAVKAKDYFQLKNKSVEEVENDSLTSYFFIKCDNVFEKINIDDVEYVQAQQNYVVFNTGEDSFMTLMPLKRVWDILPHSKFIQVHKSFIVSIEKIKTLEKSRLHLSKEIIPLSRNHKVKVHEIVLAKTLMKK